MALPEDFSKIFGSTATGGLTPIGDVDYAKGWEFVGANPPTKNDFSYLQNLSDLKSQWLYLNKLQRTDPFGDIKSDGAVQTALANLGLANGSGYVGRLLGVRVITNSGTYTPTAGTKSIVVEVQGGGGGGGGAAISGAGASVGGGGTSGCYAKALLTPIMSSYAVTVGSGGAGGIGNAQGGGGGDSSFGTAVKAMGGYGGDHMVTGSTPFIVAASSGTKPTTPVATGGNIYQINIQQQPTQGIRLSANTGTSGCGGASQFGQGGGNYSTPGNGGSASSYGAGGGGGCCIGSSAASFNGGSGANGVVIVWEYA